MRVMYFAQHLTTNVKYVVSVFHKFFLDFISYCSLCDSLSSVTTNSGTFAPPTLKSMIP